MNKLFITTLCFFSVTLSCFGQEVYRKPLCFELGLGCIYSFDRLFFDYVHPGGCVYGEFRYNFKNSPIDLGISASAQIFDRTLGSEEKLDFISKNVMLVADYSFFQNSFLTGYVGIGSGLGFFEETEILEHRGYNYYVTTGDDKYPLCIMPRIGVLVNRHLQLSLNYLFEDKANRHLGFRVGYAF